MTNIITSLLQFIRNCARVCIEFLAVLLFGAVGICLFIIPWLLRLSAVLLWLAAGYIGITRLDELYRSHTSSPIPLLALQFALILLLVAMPMAGMLRKPGYIWGAMTTSGTMIGLSFWKLVPWLLDHWQHAQIFFWELPVALSIVLLITATLRMKQLVAKGGDPPP